MKKIIYIIFPPVDRAAVARWSETPTEIRVRGRRRARSGGCVPCGFIHQAPGTDRASRPTAAAASCAEGIASEKRKGEKTLKPNRA